MSKDRTKYTKNVVDAVIKSDGAKSPIQVLKVIKDNHLKALGFTIGAMDRTSGNFPVEFSKTGEDDNKPSTVMGVLRKYKKAVAATGVKHNTLSSKTNSVTRFKAKHGDRIKAMGYENLLDKLSPENDLITLRQGLIELKKACRGNKVIRGDLQSIRIESQAFYWIAACQDVIAPLVADRAKETQEAADSRKLFINPDFIKSFAIETLENAKGADWRSLAIALVATTGRRTSEIMKTAVFKQTGDLSVMFEGHMKQKHREIFGINNKRYEIPTIADAKLVVDGLKALRAKTKDHEIEFMDETGTMVTRKLHDPKMTHNTWHNEGVNARYSRVISNHCESLMGSQDMRTYILRAAYTEIAYEMGLAKKGESRKKFRERVLGHDDNRSQANYDKFELSTDVARFAVEKQENDKPKKVDKELVDVLKKAQAIALESPRAKAVHALFEIAVNQAKSGEVSSIEEVGATWARLQVIPKQTSAVGNNTEFVKVGGAQVKKFVDVIEQAKATENQ